MQKLIDKVREDYPAAREILLSFPEDWILLGEMRMPWSTPSKHLYFAVMPSDDEMPRAGSFHGLPKEVNLSLTNYAIAGVFEPFMRPIMTMTLGGSDLPEGAIGRVEDGQVDYNLWLAKKGDGQVWYGGDTGVIWEAYLHDAVKSYPALWDEIVTKFWDLLEKFMDVSTVIAHAREDAWPKSYVEYLLARDYRPAEFFVHAMYDDSWMVKKLSK